MFGGSSWRVGRVGGVEIRIDPSWTFIAFLVAYTFWAQLTIVFDDSGAPQLIALAVLMALVFFASVLIHELAHSWVARSRGVRVRGITLFLFGGATHADLETEEPADEFLIAAVGPLTSFAVAGVFWAAAVAAGEGTLLGWASGRLGWINLALAIFNLLPGFPLDGGRILRSAVWRSTGDHLKASRIAARAGQILGYVLIGLGILQVLVGLFIGGLWLVAIGWFLSQAAQASFMQMQMRHLLQDVPASEVMSSGLVPIPAGISIDRAVNEYFMKEDFNAFPVEREGEVEGILTLSAVRAVPREDWETTEVDDIMEPLSEACTVSRSDRMSDVVPKLTDGETRRVLVTDGGSIVGMITPRDLASWVERSRRLGLTEELSRR